MKIIKANINFSFFKHIWHLSNTSIIFLSYIFSKYSCLAEYEKLKNANLNKIISFIIYLSFISNCEQQQFSEIIVKYRV